jgi:hypothetical protein
MAIDVNLAGELVERAKQADAKTFSAPVVLGDEGTRHAPRRAEDFVSPQAVSKVIFNFGFQNSTSQDAV